MVMVNPPFSPISPYFHIISPFFLEPLVVGILWRRHNVCFRFRSWPCPNHKEEPFHMHAPLTSKFPPWKVSHLCFLLFASYMSCALTTECVFHIFFTSNVCIWNERTRGQVLWEVQQFLLINWTPTNYVSTFGTGNAPYLLIYFFWN